MDSVLFGSFILVSIGLIAIPGPNILVIVSTCVIHGRLRGLQTVAGTTSAMAIQLIIASVATSGFIHMLRNGFYVIKWLGVVYLVYLGLTHIKQVFKKSGGQLNTCVTGSFMCGFIVSLTNPKTILFFTAFLPQFVSNEGDYLFQLTILSLVFLTLAGLIDSLYAVYSSRLHGVLAKRRLLGIQNSISGVLYLGAGAWLAALRRS